MLAWPSLSFMRSPCRTFLPQLGPARLLAHHLARVTSDLVLPRCDSSDTGDTVQSLKYAVA